MWIPASCICLQLGDKEPIPESWRQIAKHGNSLDGMPALQLVRGKDGHLRINDGVTRATRAAKLRPGVLVPAEVIQNLPQLDVTRMSKVKEVLP